MMTLQDNIFDGTPDTSISNGQPLLDHHTDSIIEKSSSNNEGRGPAENGTPKVNKGPPKWRSQRYILAYFAFTGILNLFLQRINLSIGIICMVNHTAIATHEQKLLIQTNGLLQEPWSNNHSSLIKNESQSLNFHQPLLGVGLTTYQTNVTFNESFLNLQQAGFISKERYRQGNESFDADKDLSKRSEKAEDNGRCSGEGSSQLQHEDGPFVWSKRVQGLLLGAIYWTYAISSIPVNHLLRNIPRKTVIAASMALLSAMTMLIHVSALWSPWAMFVVKLGQGVCTAVAIISFYGLWAAWAPPNERAGLISFGTTGQMFSSVIAFPVSAMLCKYGPFGGWPSVFYVFGVMGAIWVVLFVVFTSETPATNRFICENEKKYILSSLAHTENKKNTKVVTPWRAILSSSATWAVVSCQVSFAWNYFLLLSTGPQYLNEVLKMDIGQNGVFSMLPYIAVVITTYIGAHLSDWLIKRGILRVIWVRRNLVLIGNLTPAVCLCLLSYVDCSQPGLAISILVISVGATGFSLSGWPLVPYDMAPQHAASVMTLGNSCATLTGILAPYVVAAITTDQTREQWQIVFFLTAAILVIGTLSFCLLLKGDIKKLTSSPEKASEGNGSLHSNGKQNMEILIEADTSKLNGTEQKEDV